MRKIVEFWEECQDNPVSLLRARPNADAPFGQNVAIAYTMMQLIEQERCVLT